MDGQQSFSFRPIGIESIIQEIALLDVTKETPKHSILPNIIKDNYDVFSYKLTNDFNLPVSSGIYPRNMKYADVSPAFKKGDRLDKDNYRPVSILSSLSEIFEKDYFITRLMTIWTLNYPCINVVFERT